MKTICVVTGTRAEYGLLRPLIARLSADKEIKLCLIATGSHLCEQFGFTFNEIIQDGFRIDEKIDIEIKETSKENEIHSLSLALRKFSAFFMANEVDMVVVLGDRYEIFAAVTAAAVCHIPVSHIHGGETTQGAEDEFFRHCITKMSYLHFTACEEYRKRVIQLGEAPNRVFNVGALGVENILTLDLYSRSELSKLLGIDEKPYYLVTYHPVTMENDSAESQINELFKALDSLGDNFNIIFTKANADVGGMQINKMLREYSERKKNAFLFDSLGALRYLSLMKYALAVVGNSSSGIAEAPSFKVATVNIGDRQRGRKEASSIINCAEKSEDIKKAIRISQSEEFKKVLEVTENPYGSGDTSGKITDIIKDFVLNDKIDLKKRFYDIDFEI